MLGRFPYTGVKEHCSHFFPRSVDWELSVNYVFFSKWVWKRTVHTFFHVGVMEIFSHFFPRGCERSVQPPPPPHLGVKELYSHFFPRGCERDLFTLLSTWVWMRSVHTFPPHAGVKEKGVKLVGCLVLLTSVICLFSSENVAYRSSDTTSTRRIIMEWLYPVSMPDLIRKRFGYGQLWPLRPKCSQNQAGSY